MKTIKFEIPYRSDRQDVIVVLANSGYKVWGEEEEEKDLTGPKYFVCVQVRDDEVKS